MKWIYLKPDIFLCYLNTILTVGTKSTIFVQNFFCNNFDISCLYFCYFHHAFSKSPTSELPGVLVDFCSQCHQFETKKGPKFQKYLQHTKEKVPFRRSINKTGNTASPNMVKMAADDIFRAKRQFYIENNKTFSISVYAVCFIGWIFELFWRTLDQWGHLHRLTSFLG